MGETHVHRIVFYDLLSNPGEGGGSELPVVEPHLSIPMAPGLEAVWAPNGYGKTFAMKLLTKMRFPETYSESRLSTRGGKYWLGQFLEECYREVIEPTDSTISRDEYLRRDPMDADWSGIANWRDSRDHSMVPFSRMMVRFVTLDDDGEVEKAEDLWISLRDWIDPRESSLVAWVDDEDTEAICNLLLVDSENPSYEAVDSEFAELMEKGSDGATEDYEDEDGVIEPVFPTFPKGAWKPRIPLVAVEWHCIDPSHPEEGWELGRIHRLLEVLRNTRVAYVEVPKECHSPGKDPLEGCQRLLSSMASDIIGRRLDQIVEVGGPGLNAVDPSDLKPERLREVKEIQHIFDSINQTIMNDEKDPWARKVVEVISRDSRSFAKAPLVFERPWNNDRIDPITLSFGQRSAILLECWLGYIEYIEGLEGSSRTCLVIDEPESGRSEFSVGMMIQRFLQSRQIVGSLSKNSLMVLSHRSDVLSAVGDAYRYHVMQPFDMGLDHSGEE